MFSSKKKKSIAKFSYEKQDLLKKSAVLLQGRGAYRGMCKFGKGTNFQLPTIFQLFFLFSYTRFRRFVTRCIDGRGVDFLPRRLKSFGEEEEKREKNISLSINVSLLSLVLKEFLLHSSCRVSRISLVQNLANCEQGA